MASFGMLRVEYIAIMDTLRGIQARYKNKYCYPSQNTILKLLKDYHGIDVCRRTLNYWLKDMVKQKLIYRKNRHYRDKGEYNKPGAEGALTLRSTAYYICDRAVNAAAKVRKFFSYAKRVSSLFPSAVQKIAPNRIVTQHAFDKRPIGSGPVKEPCSEFNKGKALLESMGLKYAGVTVKES